MWQKKKHFWKWQATPLFQNPLQQQKISEFSNVLLLYCNTSQFKNKCFHPHSQPFNFRFHLTLTRPPIARPWQFFGKLFNFVNIWQYLVAFKEIACDSNDCESAALASETKKCHFDKDHFDFNIAETEHHTRLCLKCKEVDNEITPMKIDAPITHQKNFIYEEMHGCAWNVSLTWSLKLNV